MSAMPRYPVYVISKGRVARPYTVKFLNGDRVPFRLVVEPQEADAYRDVVGDGELLTLPFSNLGNGSIDARNWVWKHAKESGAERHWILDDNIVQVLRNYKGRRIPCASGGALAQAEDFTDRYENIAISGLNYRFFGGIPELPAFHLNCHVYSCMLIRCDLPNRWRGRYNEDTDLCLQVLGDGWCTVLINVFLIDKLQTMTVKGGNWEELYAGSGRLRMARALEARWTSGVAAVDRRWQRPQHVIRDGWKRFDTPLKPKPGVAVPRVDEYGARVAAVREVESRRLRDMAETFGLDASGDELFSPPEHVDHDRDEQLKLSDR